MFKMIPSFLNPNYWQKIWTQINLAWKLMRDGRIPIHHKILPALVGVYLLSPLDLIPGFLPLIGQLDDFGLLLVALSAFIRLAPDEVVNDYLPEEAAL